jgi:hypothetical protein
MAGIEKEKETRDATTMSVTPGQSSHSAKGTRCCSTGSNALCETAAALSTTARPELTSHGAEHEVREDRAAQQRHARSQPDKPAHRDHEQRRVEHQQVLRGRPPLTTMPRSVAFTSLRMLRILTTEATMAATTSTATRRTASAPVL